MGRSLSFPSWAWTGWISQNKYVLQDLEWQGQRERRCSPHRPPTGSGRPLLLFPIADWLFAPFKGIHLQPIDEHCGGSQSTHNPLTAGTLLSFNGSTKALDHCACSVAQLCPTLCTAMDCSPPSSSAHGFSQVRILEWVAISSSRGSSCPRDWTHISFVPCVGRQILYHCSQLGSANHCTYKNKPVSMKLKHFRY